MFPGIFDQTFANMVWGMAEAMVPFAFGLIILALFWRLLKSIIP